jgi:hypothetical protein
VKAKVEWTNPHSYFYVDAKDDKGIVMNSKFEGYPPRAHSREVTLADGKKLFAMRQHSRCRSPIAMRFLSTIVLIACLPAAMQAQKKTGKERLPAHVQRQTGPDRNLAKRQHRAWLLKRG